MDGFVCIGSSAYNVASLSVEKHPQSRARLHPTGAPLEVGPPGWPEEDISDRDVCFVQRVRNSNGQIRIEAAGLTTRGTDEATRYLLTHFRELERGYRGGVPFCIVLEVTDSGVSVLRRIPSPLR